MFRADQIPSPKKAAKLRETAKPWTVLKVPRRIYVIPSSFYTPSRRAGSSATRSGRRQRKKTSDWRISVCSFRQTRAKLEIKRKARIGTATSAKRWRPIITRWAAEVWASSLNSSSNNRCSNCNNSSNSFIGIRSNKSSCSIVFSSNNSSNKTWVTLWGSFPSFRVYLPTSIGKTEGEC